MKNKLFGLIYMSSYKIQLNIVDLKKLTIIEKIDSPSFGQADSKSEVFENDMTKICQALDGFKEKLAEYRINNFKFYANQQLIDDLSASYIADQIRVRTGFQVKWLSGSQIVYAKVLSGIKSFSKVKRGKLHTIPIYLLSLGSAMVNLSYFENQKFVSTWSLPLGPREIQEINEITNTTPNNPIDVIKDYIGARIDHLARQINPSPNAAIMIQHADSLSNRYLQQNDTVTRITANEFGRFYQDTINMPQAYMMQKYQLEPAVAEHTLPNLIAIRKFINLLEPAEVYITDMSVITGLLMQEAKRNLNNEIYSDNIVTTFAKNMADHYLVDRQHAEAVTKFALHIFDRLHCIHMLDEKDRQLLTLAAIVDDVGSFINQSSRYEQSAEILEANKLIGLSDKENEVVKEICRYQTIDEGPGKPDIGGHHYRNLDSHIQLKITKLSAILRIATALDASHKQKIKQIVVSLKKDNHLIIHAKTNADITLERWSFNKHVKLFEEVFGIKVSLKQEGMNR